MTGLTNLGIVHTIISLFALGAGIVALVRDREISPRNYVGKFYIWTTVLTCLTGLLLLLFLAGATLQVWRLRRRGKPTAPASSPAGSLASQP